MFVIHLKGTSVKTLSLLILVNKLIFSSKLGGEHFFGFTCWQNMSLYGQFYFPNCYLKANLNIHAQTIPQNAKCSLFFKPKVAYTQDT